MVEQYSKYLSGHVCHGLKFSEFDCHCDNDECMTMLISKRLKRAYEIFRHLLDMPIFPTCGYRCILHNYNLGSDLSRHKTGEAIDVSAINLLEKFSIEDILRFAKIAGFTYYIYYKDRNIFHLDVRETGGNL